MADAHQDIVDIPAVGESNEDSDDYQQTVSGETASVSEDDEKDLDLVQNPFSTQTNINDTALVVEGEKIYVSKPVLGLVSPVFRAMFESDMAEKKMDEIPLPGKRLSDMIEFLLCVYPDTRKPITEQNVGILVPLFSEYQVDNLKAVCDRTLAQSCEEDADIDTLFDHLLLSSTYNMEGLRRRCIQLASTRNTDTLKEAERKHALPNDVTSELWKNVTESLKSEIQSLIDMIDLLPLKQPIIIHDAFVNKFSITVSSELKQTREAFPRYKRDIQTAIDHKLPNVKDILLKMFAAAMNNTDCDIILEMGKLPKNIKDRFFIENSQVLLR